MTVHDAVVRSRFQPEPPDHEQFVRSATIVPDANVLLGMYRLSRSARGDALGALEAVRDRLWLPHQVGVEFYRNLDEVRGGLLAAYVSARKTVDAARKAVAAFGEGRRYEDSRTAVAAVVGPAVDALLVELDRLRRDDQAIVDPENDDVLARIEDLFEGRVGAEPAYEVTQERVEHFTGYRAPNLIPPGYADLKEKPQPLRAAGDYLLWCEILEYAKSEAASVLLISDDTKSDWYERTGGKSQGPRHELVREFSRHSAGGYHQMTLSRFAEVAKAVLGADVAEASLDEIEEAEEASMREVELAEQERRLARGASVVERILAESGESVLSPLQRLTLRTQGLGSAWLEDILVEMNRPYALAIDETLARAKRPLEIAMEQILADAKRPLTSEIAEIVAGAEGHDTQVDGPPDLEDRGSAEEAETSGEGGGVSFRTREDALESRDEPPESVDSGE